LIVLGGNAGEKLTANAGQFVTVPFLQDVRASQEQTDVESFAVLEPQADGFNSM
jgi:catalase-peroxidase